MATAVGILSTQFGRINDGVLSVVESLTTRDLARKIAGSNTIGWLVWHLLRVQDDHVADVAGTEQIWTTAGWRPRFGLPFPEKATGYGQSDDEVGALRTDASLLSGYAADVAAATHLFLARLVDADLERVIDDSWDPPVTLGVRLQSVIGDDLKHLGQAELLRGLL